MSVSQTRLSSSDVEALAQSAIRKNILHLVPMLMVAYFFW